MEKYHGAKDAVPRMGSLQGGCSLLRSRLVQYPALLPVMDPYGPRIRHFDLFHRGDYRTTVDWVLGDMPESWISVEPRSGTIGNDKMAERLNVTIDWEKVPAGFNETVMVDITATPSEYPYFDLLRIPMLKTNAPDSFIGYPQTAGFISIEGPGYQRQSSENETVHFEKLPYLGSRSESGSMAVRPFVDARQQNASYKAWIECDFYQFTDSDNTVATLYLTSGLDTGPKRKMEYSLTLDNDPKDMTRVLGDYISLDHVGDVPPNWMSQVMDQVWTLQVDLVPFDQGNYPLRWAVNSPEVYLEKIVLDTHGGVKPSYLGPPATTLL